jgi:hypothetical protein
VIKVFFFFGISNWKGRGFDNLYLSYFKDLSSRIGIDKTEVEKKSGDTKGERRRRKEGRDLCDGPCGFKEG